MWAIENQTPFSAERSWSRDKDGVHDWVVAVKGTFDVMDDGRLELAKLQPPPLLAAEYNGEDGESSLRYDTEVAPSKPTTDVILNGTAYAPEGRPSPDFMVGMRVGAVRKQIRVVGNRFWKRGTLGFEPTLVEPVASVPIVYERAYGGFDQTDPDPAKQKFDARNPVGCGVVSKAAHHEGKMLANFEYPGGSDKKSGPAGFGAIAAHWSPRREFLGTYDEIWEKERLPLLPTDWDPRSLLCSPADQRPAQHLRGGEPVELINLTREGRLAFNLPRVHLSFATKIDGRTEYTSGQVATVIIEPDASRLIMVWQTSLKCHSDIDYLDYTVIREKKVI
jgi:hypothetical protein